jgi:hypothetical protein
MSLTSYRGKLNKALQALCLLAYFLLSACSDQSNQYAIDTPDGKATIGEFKQTKFLFLSHTYTARIKYRAQTHQTFKTPIDVLILFDRTASMQNFISSTANAAEKIVSDIQEIAPDTRFAVAAVSDYSPLFTDDTDKRTWLLLTDFTYHSAAVETATKEIKLVNGGDTPEAYGRGLYEASQLDWRNDAKKIIIFFGDATAHEVDPGRDETFNTVDDLQFTQVIATLKAKNINLIGIHTRNDSNVVDAFKKMSAATGSQAISLSNASDSAQVIKNSITEALSDPPHMQAYGQYASWISTNDTGKANPNKIDYQVHINVPFGTDAGVYTIPLKLTATTTSNELINKLVDKPFEITIIIGWYNHPVILWLPLILLLLYLLISAILMMKGGYSHKKHITSSSSFNADLYGITYLLLDILALTSLTCTAIAIYLCTTGQVLSQIL